MLTAAFLLALLCSAPSRTDKVLALLISGSQLFNPSTLTGLHIMRVWNTLTVPDFWSSAAHFLLFDFHKRLSDVRSWSVKISFQPNFLSWWFTTYLSRVWSCFNPISVVSSVSLFLFPAETYQSLQYFSNGRLLPVCLDKSSWWLLSWPLCLSKSTFVFNRGFLCACVCAHTLFWGCTVFRRTLRGSVKYFFF